MSICVTTGFKNIGRENWDRFYRDDKDYFEGFRKLVKTCPYPLVAYLEEKEREIVKNLSSPFLRVFAMEDCDLLAYSHWEKDWEILNSPVYNILMYKCHHESHHPERSREGYNMVTSSKSNMLVETKKRCPGFEFYAWQDFGQANNDGGLPVKIDPSKLSKDKIVVNGTVLDPTSKFRIDPVGMARTGGATYVCSAQIIVPTDLVEWFDDEMRKQVDFNHSIGLSDDDQSVLAQVVNNNRSEEKFEWVKCYPDWFALWRKLAER